jgi:hypothetical protein
MAIHDLPQPTEAGDVQVDIPTDRHLQPLRPLAAAALVGLAVQRPA